MILLLFYASALALAATAFNVYKVRVMGGALNTKVWIRWLGVATGVAATLAAAWFKNVPVATSLSLSTAGQIWLLRAAYRHRAIQAFASWQ